MRLGREITFGKHFSCVGFAALPAESVLCGGAAVGRSRGPSAPGAIPSPGDACCPAPALLGGLWTPSRHLPWWDNMSSTHPFDKGRILKNFIFIPNFTKQPSRFMSVVQH